MLLKDIVRGWLKKYSFGFLSVWHILRSDSFLVRKGWFRSYRNNAPMDREGNPLPWISYSMIHFLEGRLTKSMNVFEYGAGQSTLWFSSKVNSVVSLEHSEDWYELINNKLPDNCELHCKSLEDNSYQNKILEFEKYFDVVLIDGRERVKTLENCISALKDDGVIVFDNSDRFRYQEGLQKIKEKGFKRIDFYGMGPTDAVHFATSIFYRSNNCFDI